MNLVIERIGREINSDDEIIDNFSYEFFNANNAIDLENKNSNSIQQDKIEVNENNSVNNMNNNNETNNNENNNNKINNNKNNENNNIDNNENSNNKIENKKKILNSKDINNDNKIKQKNKVNNKNINYDMIIDFDEENIEKRDSNNNNYSLDQEDILEILNLNNDNNNNSNTNEEKNLFDKLNAKILLKDLQEKKNQFKNAYVEYSMKLKETMKNDYVKNIIEMPDKKGNKNKIKNDFLIHQQTNTINDINIFCLNNKDNNNNFINFNNQENKLFNNNINNKSNINIINFELIKNSDNIKDLKEFIKDYNNSIQKRAFMDMKKNPNINYEIFIDILNDLNYIDISISPQIYFANNSIYKNLFNFLIKINNNNENSTNKKVNFESNSLLIFLLILNGFFNSIKKLIEIKRELNWLKIENYEILIINDKYIENNFGALKEIKEKNRKKLIEENPDIYKLSDNINFINSQEKQMNSIEISNFHDDIISNYFKSYDLINNNEINTNNKNNKNKQHNSTNKLSKTKNYIKNNDISKKQLYAFKPKIKNISFNVEPNENKRKYSYKKNLNKYSANSSINNIDLKKSLNKSISKSKIKQKINYIDFVNLSQNEIRQKNNKSFINNNIRRRNENSNSNLKSRKYYNKIKQNRTDLMRLFKNNKYKEGSININEKYEEIKRKRESNSKSKRANIRINYENVVNISTNDNDNINNNENNHKHKFQFKKKENS